MTLIYGIIKCYQTLVIWNKWLHIIFLPLWTPRFIFTAIHLLFFFHYVIVIKYFANIYCL